VSETIAEAIELMALRIRVAKLEEAIRDAIETLDGVYMDGSGQVGLAQHDLRYALEDKP
jgi:hypothetical protein